ncbi:guanosine-3',5'-bis(diphosphate) 3'-pyrophosphohydrolase MESH1-like isoform X3 [Varroa jacobsoni]|uniref:guanosine-3',5'-bis(diphosphate) 3'-pyrophosphohydrolase MESH1-like isoform X3 n=1 Tax=Varroa jacobsoni TaxID=62625 RepID=UPI000BF56E41|nr:guanosine-3',5'-bis(diphosphate) 3'-pyrophosphohydrolase MESH1-like isoform X3 [Varroa jacobsoni]
MCLAVVTVYLFYSMAKTCLNLSDFVRACHFAAVKHKNQRRKCVEDIPYINHPIGVAYHLVEYGITDAVTLCAAVLHDTVEDTDATFKEIEEHFGAEVEWIVREHEIAQRIIFIKQKTSNIFI